ncbi:MAG TPA: hypothetical protein VMA71_02585 [Alloacidobacterium sp.]|nr:hypothetical protein [Alloacidobacterium sp.]
MAFSEQEKILLEKRLKNYTEKLVRLLEQLETESGETFVPHIADMALTWALLMRMVTQLGGEAGINASRELLEETIERFRPNLSNIAHILEDGGTE